MAFSTSVSAHNKIDLQPLLAETAELSNMVDTYKQSLPGIVYNKMKKIFIEEDEEFVPDREPTQEEIQQHIRQTHIKRRIKQLELELKQLHESLTLLNGETI